MQNNIKNKTNLRSFKMKNRNIGKADISAIKIQLTKQSTDEQIFERIQKLINVKKNHISLDKITRESDLKDDLDFYDSLDLIVLIIDIEELFNIKITDETTENLKNVGHLLERVKNVQNSLPS